MNRCKESVCFFCILCLVTGILSVGAKAADYGENKEIFQEVPLYFQTDYPETMFGSGSIATSGCSITALAMVATYMTGHEYLPDELARYFGGTAENNIPNTQMTVHDVVMLGRKPYMRWGFTEADHKIVHEAMQKLNLEHLRGRFLNQLSGGERQKVMLARALAQQPELLLLDEPTSSLDIHNQYQVLKIVQDLCHNDGLTAIIVIHDLNLETRSTVYRIVT